jgi:hypothetical protein
MTSIESGTPFDMTTTDVPTAVVTIGTFSGDAIATKVPSHWTAVHPACPRKPVPRPSLTCDHLSRPFTSPAPVVLPCLQENAAAYREAAYEFVRENEESLPLLLEARQTSLVVLEKADIRLENAKRAVIAISQERIEAENAHEQRVKEMMDALEQKKKELEQKKKELEQKKKAWEEAV